MLLDIVFFKPIACTLRKKYFPQKSRSVLWNLIELSESNVMKFSFIFGLIWSAYFQEKCGELNLGHWWFNKRIHETWELSIFYFRYMLMLKISRFYKKYKLNLVSRIGVIGLNVFYVTFSCTKLSINVSHLICHFESASIFSVSFKELYWMELMANFLSVRKSLCRDAMPRNVM